MLHLLHVTMLHENYFTRRLVGSILDVLMQVFLNNLFLLNFIKKRIVSL